MPAKVPYFKQGGSIGTDPWNMKGEGEHAKIVGGQVEDSMIWH